MNSALGFLISREAANTKESMTITADFGTLTRVKDVIISKFGTQAFGISLCEYVKSFRLEYLNSLGKWVTRGVFSTGLQDDDDSNAARIVKLDKPVMTKTVRVVIEHDMQSSEYQSGRLGFRAETVIDRLCIKRAIDDYLSFKRAD